MKLIFSFIAPILLLCQTAYASCGARGFDSTYGSGTTDVVKAGYSTGISSTMSWFAQFWINGAGGNNGGRMIDQYNTAGVVGGTDIQMSGGTTSMQMQATFSGGDGEFSWTAPSTSAWHTIVLTYNASATSNKPTVYIDGASVSVTVTTSPTGTVTTLTGNYYIGNREDGIRVWDGKIGNIAVWNGAILTANEALALAQGASPLQVRPASLSMYIPNCGLQASEPDWGIGHHTQTITGTLDISGMADSGYPLMTTGH